MAYFTREKVASFAPISATLFVHNANIYKHRKAMKNTIAKAISLSLSLP
jgi:hypothetical protein